MLIPITRPNCLCKFIEKAVQRKFKTVQLKYTFVSISERYNRRLRHIYCIFPHITCIFTRLILPANAWTSTIQQPHYPRSKYRSNEARISKMLYQTESNYQSTIKTTHLPTLLDSITQSTGSKSNFHYPVADGEGKTRRGNDRRVCGARSVQKGNNTRVGESSSEVTADPIVATATAYRHARQVSTRSFLQRLPINIVDDGSKRMIPAAFLTIYDQGHALLPDRSRNRAKTRRRHQRRKEAWYDQTNRRHWRSNFPYLTRYSLSPELAVFYYYRR